MPVPVREIRHPATTELDLATILRTVGDPLRLAVVRMLSDDRERTCSDIQDELGLPMSTCSYHLRLLREAGLTRTRAEGTERHIRLRRDDLNDRFPGLVEVLVERR
ncbi:MAG TPA: metalloregulator ArsR/SmtB family transcription factor [Thermoleophilaceae bacterium]|jgi:DNA-binding transcriptional ArsR family regulator|nr:metalloregulator ArsR/SmtB family transcription factor [Thermoleophilaceae bacterium]